MEEISTLFYVLDGIFNNSKQSELFSTEYVFDDAELLKSLGKLDYSPPEELIKKILSEVI